MASRRKEIFPLGRLKELAGRTDADRLLLKPQKNSGWDYEVISFASRKALEAFNVRAGLKPVIFTQVPLNCAVHAHQSDSEARASIKK